MRLNTVATAAGRLDRNPELVRRWIREGRLKAVKIGRWEWFIGERDLVAFLRSQPRRRALRRSAR